jgi:ABC-type sugar transport system ATPase subunit
MNALVAPQGGTRVPLVAMRGISMRYGGLQALRGVNFSVMPGEIACLLGENGAGKSTLVKILAGALQGFGGSIDWAEGVRPQVGMVFQEFNLASNLSAAENTALGNEPSGLFGRLDRAAMRRRALEAFAELGLELDPDAPVSSLSPALQQMLEIAKALASRPSLLILDEPSSALSSAEIGKLFSLLRRLKARGLSMVYISHKLSEIRELCDRVVVLKDGENSGEADPKACSEAELVAMMVGRDLPPAAARAPRPSAAPLLSVRGLSGPPRLAGISFDLHAGEILGLGGLMGAGRTELARLLMGEARASGGSMLLDGSAFRPSGPAQAVAAGLAYVPEDRKAHGLIRHMDVAGHVALAAPRRVARASGIFRRGRVTALARSFIRRLRIKAQPRQEAFQLSGGNQQKVVLARALAGQPRILILDEPTRGVDVGAKAEIHRQILDLAAKGMAVILISSELPELLGLADRVLVLREGRVEAELSGAAMDEAAVTAAAFGQKGET